MQGTNSLLRRSHPDRPGGYKGLKGAIDRKKFNQSLDTSSLKARLLHAAPASCSYIIIFQEVVTFHKIKFHKRNS